MTDITELAQSLKSAAKKAIAEEGSTWWNEEQLASDYGLALHRTDAKFIALASHENVLALVEALEKAQQRIAELESRLDSADKLQDSAFRSGLQHGFSLGQTDDEKGYEQSVDAYSSAAGIKREAE